MIAVIDYQAGNLTSVVKALRTVTADLQVTSDPAAVRSADRIVLPGVGHFAATQRLQETGLTAAVRASVSRGVPFLGICVGLQWLFSGSEESQETEGLGIFRGRCTRFAGDLKVPHVGWNSLRLLQGRESQLLHGIPEGAFVYYTHAYSAGVVEDTVAATEYGCAFTAAAERGHVCGVQFHPEKSGETGLRMLRNFVERVGAC